jgi:hypothetical protein
LLGGKGKILEVTGSFKLNSRNVTASNGMNRKKVQNHKASFGLKFFKLQISSNLSQKIWQIWQISHLNCKNM